MQPGATPSATSTSMSTSRRLDPRTTGASSARRKFGEVVLTDILLSEQRIRRNNRHISQLDKDCYYLQLFTTAISTSSSAARRIARTPRAARSSPPPSSTSSSAWARSARFYLEIPRDEFAQRFPRERVPVSATINSTRGMGRIATEFCASLAAEGAKLAEDAARILASQLMDMLAFTLLSAEGEMPEAEGSVQKARLRSVQQWIEAHLGDPDLSLERIAGANGMSLRYLHVLFEQCEMSASEWIWNRRLQRCYDQIAEARWPVDHLNRLRARIQQLGAFQHDVPPQVRRLPEKCCVRASGRDDQTRGLSRQLRFPAFTAAAPSARTCCEDTRASRQSEKCRWRLSPPLPRRENL